MSSKRFHFMALSASSSSSRSSRFIYSENEAYYLKLKENNITKSKYLDQSCLRHPITQLFQYSALLTLLTLCFAYNKELIYELYANIEILISHQRITSRVHSTDVKLTKEDFLIFIGVSCEGLSAFMESTCFEFDWMDVNRVIQDCEYCWHMSSLNDLEDDIKVIEHVLWTYVVPKVGDCGSISLFLSLAPYCIMDKN